MLSQTIRFRGGPWDRRTMFSSDNLVPARILEFEEEDGTPLGEYQFVVVRMNDPVTKRAAFVGVYKWKGKDL